MYAKVLPGSNFVGLANYLVGQDKDYVAWTHTHNLVAEQPAEVAREMELTAQANERVRQPVRHFVVSFSPHENPDSETMQEVAEQVLRDLGLEKHQAFVVAHDDTPNPHFHIMVNRVRQGGREVWQTSYEGRRLGESIERQEQALSRRRRLTQQGRVQGDGAPLPSPTSAGDASHRETVNEPRPMTMPPPDKPTASDGEDALGFAARYYAEKLKTLPDDHPARRYLEERGFEAEALERFGIGYAEDAWDDLRQAAAQEGISAEALAEVGLANERRSGSGHYDRFRGRIMFPVRDADGQVRGFGGRRVEGMPLETHTKGEPPKYVNTRKTSFYNKSELFFGLAQARPAIERQGEVTVVEGYTDALRLNQAGKQDVVALAGTRLTDEHAERIGAFAERATLMLDGDAGGRRAAGPAAEKLLRAGVNPKVVTLPDGEDPGALVRERGLEALRQYQASDETTVAEAMLRSAVEHEKQRASHDDTAPANLAGARAKAADNTLSAAAGLDDEAQRDFYFQQIVQGTQPAESLTRDEAARHEAALGTVMKRHLDEHGHEIAALPILDQGTQPEAVLPRAGDDAAAFYQSLLGTVQRNLPPRQTARPARSKGASQAGLIPEAKVEEVKQATPMVTLAQEYTAMREAGDDDWVGLSPFSNEENPSFHVTPSINKYYDFSTDQGGDQITFVQRMEGLNFPDAVRHLAGRAGVEIDVSSPRSSPSVTREDAGEISRNGRSEREAEQKGTADAVDHLPDDFRERIRAAGDALGEDKTLAAYRIELAERGIQLSRNEEDAWTLIDRKSSHRDVQVSLHDVVAARRAGRLVPDAPEKDHDASAETKRPQAEKAHADQNTELPAGSAPDLPAKQPTPEPSEDVRQAYRDVQKALVTVEAPLIEGNSASDAAEHTEAMDTLRTYHTRLEDYAAGVQDQLEDADLSPAENDRLQRQLDASQYRKERIGAALRRGENIQLARSHAQKIYAHPAQAAHTITEALAEKGESQVAETLRYEPDTYGQVKGLTLGPYASSVRQEAHDAAQALASRFQQNTARPEAAGRYVVVPVQQPDGARQLLLHRPSTREFHLAKDVSSREWQEAMRGAGPSRWTGQAARVVEPNVPSKQLDALNPEEAATLEERTERRADAPHTLDLSEQPQKTHEQREHQQRSRQNQRPSEHTQSGGGDRSSADARQDDPAGRASRHGGTPAGRDRAGHRGESAGRVRAGSPQNLGTRSDESRGASHDRGDGTGREGSPGLSNGRARGSPEDVSRGGAGNGQRSRGDRRGLHHRERTASGGAASGRHRGESGAGRRDGRLDEGGAARGATANATAHTNGQHHPLEGSRADAAHQHRGRLGGADDSGRRAPVDGRAAVGPATQRLETLAEEYAHVHGLKASRDTLREMNAAGEQSARQIKRAARQAENHFEEQLASIYARPDAARRSFDRLYEKDGFAKAMQTVADDPQALGTLKGTRIAGWENQKRQAARNAAETLHRAGGNRLASAAAAHVLSGSHDVQARHEALSAEASTAEQDVQQAFASTFEDPREAQVRFEEAAGTARRTDHYEAAREAIVTSPERFGALRGEHQAAQEQAADLPAKYAHHLKMERQLRRMETAVGRAKETLEDYRREFERISAEIDQQRSPSDITDEAARAVEDAGPEERRAIRDVLDGMAAGDSAQLAADKFELQVEWAYEQASPERQAHMRETIAQISPNKAHRALDEHSSTREVARAAQEAYRDASDDDRVVLRAMLSRRNGKAVSGTAPGRKIAAQQQVAQRLGAALGGKGAKSAFAAALKRRIESLAVHQAMETTKKVTGMGRDI